MMIFRGIQYYRSLTDIASCLQIIDINHQPLL